MTNAELRQAIKDTHEAIRGSTELSKKSEFVEHLKLLLREEANRAIERPIIDNKLDKDYAGGL